MQTRITHIIALSVISTCISFLASTPAHAQKDSAQFEFIPKYSPEDDFIPTSQPDIAYAPNLVFPSDPGLQGKQADVWVKVLVNRNGSVIRAKILKSSDEAFNKYALKYAKQYKYKWNQKWPDELKDTTKGLWASIPARFRP